MSWSDTFSSGQYIIHFLSEEKITVLKILSFQSFIMLLTLMDFLFTLWLLWKQLYRR